MSLNQRQLGIITKLLNERDFMTSNELAKIFHVSNRTIKNDYKIIVDFLNDRKIKYEINKKDGIRIVSTDDAEFNNVLLKEFNFGHYRTEYQQRAFLLLRLIVNKIGWFTIDTLANEMNLSKSVINEEMPEVLFRLSRYGLSVETKPHYGMRVVGTEINKRCAIIDTFDVIDYDLSNMHYINELKGISSCDFENLKINLVHLYKCFGVEIQDVLVEKIVLAIIISLIRTSSGAIISTEIKELKNSRMKYILEELLGSLHLQFVESDVLFCALYALSFIVPNNQDEYSDYFGDFFEESRDMVANVNDYLMNCWNYQIIDGHVLTELSKFCLHFVISKKYKINALFFSRDISLWTSKMPATIDFVYNIFEDMRLSVAYECPRYLLYYAALIVDMIINSHNKSIWFNRIVIVSNFNNIVAFKYKSLVEKFFGNILPVHIGTYESDNKTIYIVIDNRSINGPNVINVLYEVDESYLLSSISNLIDEYNYKDILFDYREINCKDDIDNIDDLFEFISNIFNQSTSSILKTKDYLIRRQQARSIDYCSKNYNFIVLFDQETQGIRRITFENMVHIRNRFVKDIIIFSLNKSNINEYIKVQKIQNCLLKD